jgi:hypothetical protein
VINATFRFVSILSCLLADRILMRRPSYAIRCSVVS